MRLDMFRKIATLFGGLCFAAFAAAASPEVSAQETEALAARQRAIVPIAAFTAVGDIDRLKPSLDTGLDAGLTVNEIKEVLVQMYAYAGFPRSLNGLNAFMAVLDERAARGMTEDVGREAAPYPVDKSRRELGTEIQTLLIGHQATGRIFEFSPAIDVFLKDHLFGDIFGRDVLSFEDREIATVSALATMTGTGGQLRSHCNASLNVGVTEAELRGVIAVLRARVGAKEADAAAAALAETLAKRKD
jgi:alkylhydroperoxidase/carboxymuconolactone decarboxylase family protein YurZ